MMQNPILFIQDENMKIRRTAPLVAGAIIYLFIGLIYAWSIFVAPLEADFGWTRAQTSLTFTVSMSFFCLGGIASGIISKKLKSRSVVWIAAIFLLAGFVLASRINSIFGLYIAYGVCCGFGVGLAYNINISTVTKWYPDKVGLISGVLLMCFGFGGMLLGSVASKMLIAIGWRTTFVLLGCIFAAVLLVSSFWIVPPGKDIILPENKNKQSGNENEKVGISSNAKEMIKRKEFWIYFVWVVFLSASGLAVISQSASCVKDIGSSAATGALVAGLVSVCNGAGRILFGTLYDRLGRKISMILDNIIMIVAFALMAYSTVFSSVNIFFAGAMLLGICYGGLPPTSSSVVNEFYGKENYALNFSVMNVSIIPASILGPYVAGIMRTSTGTYTSVFILMFFLCVVSFGVQLFIKKPVYNLISISEQVSKIN
jgi:MFS transporter, OFA family, oxalate/formate antiporter